MNQNKKSIIPVLLSILIGCFILFLAWSGKQASTGGTDVTDSDYYSKGLKYNSTLVEKKAASVIGWQLQTRLEESFLIFNLSDKNGRPILAANGKLTLPIPGGNLVQTLTLSEENPGTYQTELPADLRGERPVRVDFELNGARINRQLLLSIADPSGSKVK